MSAIWRRAGELQAHGVPFAAAMRQAREELDPEYRWRQSEIARLLGAWIPVTEDALVDAGYDVPGYEERQARKAEASERYWRSLPWHVRLRRTLSAWRDRRRQRALDWIHARLYPEHDW